MLESGGRFKMACTRNLNLGIQPLSVSYPPTLCRYSIPPFQAHILIITLARGGSFTETNGCLQGFIGGFSEIDRTEQEGEGRRKVKVGGLQSAMLRSGFADLSTPICGGKCQSGQFMTWKSDGGGKTHLTIVRRGVITFSPLYVHELKYLKVCWKHNW